MIGLARRVRVAWSVSCLCLTAAVFEASLFHADVVQAQPSGTERETARALVGEGDRLFAAKDYANALARYSSAYRLVRAPTVGIEVAKAQAALGRLIEANTTLIDIINAPVQANEPQVFKEARATASDLSRRLSARIPSVQVETLPAAATPVVRIDGTEMPDAIREVALKINPGAHVLNVAAPGFESMQRQFVLKEGEQRVLHIALAPSRTAAVPPAAPAKAAAGAAPSPAKPAQPSAARGGDVSDAEADAAAARTRAYVALGIAGVGAAVGSVAGTLAFVRKGKADCDGDSCSPDSQSDIDASKTFGHVADISFGVAIVAGVYGLYELLANGSAPESSASGALAPHSLTIAPNAGGAGVLYSGRF